MKLQWDSRRCELDKRILLLSVFLVMECGRQERETKPKMWWIIQQQSSSSRDVLTRFLSRGHEFSFCSCYASSETFFSSIKSLTSAQRAFAIRVFALQIVIRREIHEKHKYEFMNLLVFCEQQIFRTVFSRGKHWNKNWRIVLLFDLTTGSLLSFSARAFCAASKSD